MTEIERNVIAIGKTGVGKSLILSRLLGKTNIFVSSGGIEPVTEEITIATRQVNVEEHHLPFKLTAYDTPGISDPNGRTRQFLDDIMGTIQRHKFHHIIIIVKYGVYDTDIQNNLQVLNLCLNGLNSSNSMLIINRVFIK